MYELLVEMEMGKQRKIESQVNVHKKVNRHYKNITETMAMDQNHDSFQKELNKNASCKLVILPLRAIKIKFLKQKIQKSEIVSLRLLRHVLAHDCPPAESEQLELELKSQLLATVSESPPIEKPVELTCRSY